MTAFGIALIVIGVALICGGLILRLLRPGVSRREPVVAFKEEDRAQRSAMANVRPRLDEIEKPYSHDQATNESGVSGSRT